MKNLLLTTIVFVGILSGCVQKQPAKNDSRESPAPSSSVIQALQISQTLISPEETIENTNLSVQATESALDILRRTHTVEVKQYSFGDIADSINGTRGGSNGRYWIFYVNGKMSEVGAGEYHPKDGDQIIWKYQKENENL